MRLGSLFSGYEGLGLALKAIWPDAETVFVADVCKHTKTKDGRHEVGHYEPHRAPCSILAHRLPDVPNLGDVSLIDWTPWRGLIEVLTAGFPCTDVSTAGRRAGLKEGTRTGLWSQVVRAITELRPRLVVLENVLGIFTAPAAGDVEPCPWCVGDDPAGNLRALDAVLADLAALGFDAEWVTLPASGVGAAHKRERWFCLAWPAEHTASAGSQGRSGGRVQHGLSGEGHCGTLLPTPRATDGTKCGPGQRGSSGDLMLPSAVALLPTPAVNDMGEGKTPERWDEWTADMQTKHGNGNGHGKSLAIEAQRLLPTPSVADSEGGHEGRGCKRGDEQQLNGVAKAQADGKLLPTPRVKNNENRQTADYGGEDGNYYGLLRDPDRWGNYAPAIARWEHILGRPAPAPTMTSRKGNPQLSPRFVEWLMGLPEGWVTDVPGITRNEALKACGNGVVIQQVEAAVRWLLAAYYEAVAA